MGSTDLCSVKCLQCCACFFTVDVVGLVISAAIQWGGRGGAVSFHHRSARHIPKVHVSRGDRHLQGSTFCASMLGHVNLHSMIIIANHVNQWSVFGVHHNSLCK